MKIMFPHGEATETEFEYYCVRPAKILRQYIWSQLQTLDAEYGSMRLKSPLESPRIDYR
jgi:ATP-dependent Lon protease